MRDRPRPAQIPPRLAPPDDHHEHDPHEPPHAKRERFARIRRIRQMLRYMPRRAVMHNYPLIGRFAEIARRRAYLWSFRYENMRPSLYAGSILSLLPLMGVQLPLAFVLSLLLRANFMVMGGLQFITNPFTAAPVYYATHELGAYVISVAGFGEALAAADPNEPVLPLNEVAAAADAPPDAPPKSASTVRKIGTAINALIVGGMLSGAALGLLLDILYRNYWRHYTLRHPRLLRPPDPDGKPAD